MDTVRRIAAAYYARASEQEREVAKEFFRKLDVNGDGIITREQLRKSLGSMLSSERVFKQLDENSDGTLDFQEVLAAYYMSNKTKIQVCCGCYALLVGPYFSCFSCVRKTPASFDLCCDCYHKGSVDHEHSADHFLDHHSLVEKLKVSHVEAVKSPRKRQMEELLEIAKSHYLAASSQVQSLAYEFFRLMDTDGDGRVDLHEFISFMRQEGYVQMRNSCFFDELDQDCNGSLDFYEVMTLYYIIKSRRPFCDCCGDFIPGAYFPCVECFKHRETTSFYLCPDCYRNKKCVHTHDGRSQFLDNYTLLEAKIDSSSSSSVVPNSTDEVIPIAMPYNPPPYTTSPYYHHQPYYYYPPYAAPNPSSSSSRAIVRGSRASNNHDKWEKWRVALRALEVAMGFASLGVGVTAAVTTGCTIM